MSNICHIFKKAPVVNQVACVSRLFNRMAVLPLTLPLCLVLVLGMGDVWGQVDIASTNTFVTTSWDGWNGTEPTGFTQSQTYIGTTAATTGGTYAIASSGLGWQASSSVNSLSVVGTFKNTTGSTQTSVTIEYDAFQIVNRTSRTPGWAVTSSLGTVSALNWTFDDTKSAASPAVLSVTLTGLSITNNGTFTVTWASDRGGGSGSSPLIGLRNVKVKFNAASTPTLNAVTLSSSLSSTYGTASTGVSFAVGGSNLTTTITVTPQSGYEIATTSGGTYQSTAMSGVADGATLWVRFPSTRSAGTYNNATAVVLSGGGASSNANVTTSSSGNTVSQKALTVTGLTAQNKVYDGLTAATATGTAALVGVVGGDAVSLTGTPTFTFVNATVGNGKTVNTTNYSLTGAQAGNYTLTQPTLSANITVRSLTITANDVTKIFGNTLTGGAGSTAFTSSGLQSSETIGSVTITYGTGAASGDAAGTYAGSVTPSAATGGSFTASNYSITYVSGSITVVNLVNFDTAGNWTGSGSLTSYSSGHTYSSSGWSFTGGPALRQTTTAQDGFAGAFDTYAWRLQENSSVAWTATWTTAGTMKSFGFDVRRWDADPSPNFIVEYSVNGGSSYTSTGITINNDYLGNSSNWTSLSFNLPSPAAVSANGFVVRVRALGATERIMIDNFTWSEETASVFAGAVSGAPFTMAGCGSTQASSIAYTVSGVFTGGNVFTAELSDGNGEFTQPLAIGSVTATTAGNIAVTIPENLQTGSGYRIRILSSNPATVGTSSAAFTITQNGEYCPQIGDYQTIGSNTWATVGIWQTYNYVSASKSRVWQNAASQPNNAAINIYVRNAHTVTLSDGPKSINHLIVDAGGRLYNNNATCGGFNYVNLRGDILCNGNIGNGATSDAIGFNIQAGNHIIKGNGTFNAWRIRLSDESNVEGAVPGNAALVIDMNVNLRWNPDLCSNAGANAIYSNRNGTANLDVTINAGKTLFITESNASFGMDGANSSSGYVATERGGGYTVFGTIDCAGHYMLGSDNSSAKPYLIIKNGGLVKTGYLDYGDDNSASGGALTIENGGKLEITGAGASNTTWVDNTVGSIVFDIQSGSTIEYSGSVAQNVHGALFDYSNLVIDKAANDISLIGNLSVLNNLNLHSGNVNTTASDLMIIQNNATVSGANNASHINGPCRKVGNQAFTFPIGKNGLLRTAGLSAPSSTTDHFTAEYFDQNPSPVYSSSSLDASLDNVSTCEYWIIDRTNGSSSASATLTWDAATSCGIAALADLRVARWNGALWADEGNNSTTGNTTSGSILSGTISSFSPFTLASASSANPLPIKLVDFTASIVREETAVLLDWQTESEVNNDFFTIERSSDGYNWLAIHKASGAGSSNSLLRYEHLDENPLSGISYYRLKQTDFDGEYEYFPVRSVILSNDMNGKVLYRVNSLGQRVDESYKGLVILYYPNGTIHKVIQH